MRTKCIQTNIVQFWRSSLHNRHINWCTLKANTCVCVLILVDIPFKKKISLLCKHLRIVLPKRFSKWINNKSFKHFLYVDYKGFISSFKRVIQPKANLHVMTTQNDSYSNRVCINVLTFRLMPIRTTKMRKWPWNSYPSL